MLPNTFVAGAQKSGTTTICTLLSLHPECILSNPKEPTFFCRKDNLDKLGIYESYFRQSEKITTTRCIIDGSTAYMVDPEVPARIRDTLGDDLYFIFSLRKPVDRTISAYWQMVKKGYEQRPVNDVLTFESDTLDEAILEEEEKLKYAVRLGLVNIAVYEKRYDDPLWNYRYLRNSHYRKDLARYFMLFPRDRIKVVLFEDLVTDAPKMMHQIAHFLRLDPELMKSDGQMHYNPSRLPRWEMLSRRIIPIFRSVPGKSFLHRIPGISLSYNLLFSYKMPVADKKIVDKISGMFNRELVDLSEMIRRDLQIWT